MSFTGASLTNVESVRYTDTTCPLLGHNTVGHRRYTVGHGRSWDPAPHNHFYISLVEFDDNGNRLWKNPHTSIIMPLKPPKFTGFQNLPEALKRGVSCETGEDGQTGKRFTLDPFVKALCTLKLEDLVNLSQTSIWCYLATKEEAIWQSQFVKFFPGVPPMPKLDPDMYNGIGSFDMKEVSIYPTEWQFKIYFKRMTDELKIYQVQFEHNKEVLKKQKNRRDAVRDKLKLVGKNYNGTKKSISPYSQQGLCLSVKAWIPEAFNNPDIFKKTMERAQIINQNMSRETCDPLRNSTPNVVDASAPQLKARPGKMET